MTRFRRSLSHQEVLQEKIAVKKHADESWDRVFADCLKGNVDTDKIWRAVDQCNIADKAVLAQEKM